MVHKAHAELGLESHRFREHSDHLSHDGFAVGHARVVDEDYALSSALDRRPTLFIFEIPGDVPELQVDFAETGNSRWRVALAFYDP